MVWWERTQIERLIRTHGVWFVGSLVVALVPVVFLREMLFQPGYPYLHDGLSNLLPPLHARHSLLNGQLPIYTDLWYGGRPQFLNPLWKGLYPPAWPLFIPGIPMLPSIKAILGVHYIASGIIAYYYASRDFSVPVAVCFGLLAVVPMTMFVGHYEKVLGWPWAILILANLLPHRLEAPKAGYLIGGGLGAMLLAGDNYHFFYFGLFVAVVVITTKAWHQFKPLLLGGLVGLPKFLLAIVPTLLAETSRPVGGRALSLWELGVGVVGFWLDISTLAIEFSTHRVLEGFAPVGIGVPVLAILSVLYAYLYVPDAWQSAAGGTIAGTIGLVLATRWETLQSFPVVSTFRVSARAIVLVSASALFISWLGTLWSPDFQRVIRRGVIALLVLSTVSGVVTFAAVEGAQSQQLPQGVEMADDIVAGGCEDVWIEGTYDGLRTPYQKPLAYELTKRGVALQAVNYGKIGQEYSAVRDGALTFDTLVVGKPIPEIGDIQLTGGWGRPPRGQVSVDALDLERVYHYPSGSVYIYTTSACDLAE